MNDYTEFCVMDKADFLASTQYQEMVSGGQVYSVYIEQREVARFDLRYHLELIGEDDMYDGWLDDVYADVEDAPETVAFMELMKRVFESHPTYYMGEAVMVDTLEGCD